MFASGSCDTCCRAPPYAAFLPGPCPLQHGHAALEVAAREGRHGALRVLLSRGARANAVDKVGVPVGRDPEGRGAPAERKTSLCLP